MGGMMNFFERWYAGREIKKTLKGRIRRINQPEKGRFINSDVDKILERTWHNYDELLPHAPKYKKYGNRSLMNSGVFSLALYRVLLDLVKDKTYATQLTADLLWKFYEKSLKSPAVLSRMIYRDREKQMEILGKWGTKYRFCPPAYKVETRFENATFFMDFYRCPICDYFREQGEEELEFFRNTWCTFDWAAMEAMIEGPVRYERNQTLSAGDQVCDMRWKVLSKNP